MGWLIKMTKIDYKKFFGRKAEVVARDLLGRLLVRDTETGATGGKIVETGAYEGGKITPSRQGMEYEPGALFLMSVRGSRLLNIATEKEGKPSCVEIRAVEFHDGVLEGPGKISKYLDLDASYDGFPLGDEVKVLYEGVRKSKIEKTSDGVADNCIGYFSIKE